MECTLNKSLMNFEQFLHKFEQFFHKFDLMQNGENEVKTSYRQNLLVNFNETCLNLYNKFMHVYVRTQIHHNKTITSMLNP